MAQMQLQMEQMNNKQDRILSNINNLENGVTNNISNVQNHLNLLASNTNKLTDRQEEQLSAARESNETLRRQSEMLNELDLSEVMSAIPKIQDYLAARRPRSISIAEAQNGDSRDSHENSPVNSPVAEEIKTGQIYPKSKAKKSNGNNVLNTMDDMLLTPILDAKHAKNDTDTSPVSPLQGLSNPAPVDDLFEDINPLNENNNAENAELTLMDSDSETIGVVNGDRKKIKKKKENTLQLELELEQEQEKKENKEDKENKENDSNKFIDDLSFDNSVNYNPFPPPTPTASTTASTASKAKTKHSRSSSTGSLLSLTSDDNLLSRVNVSESRKSSLRDLSKATSASLGGGFSGAAYEIGKKLDVLDGSYYWYSAQVVDVDPFKKKAIRVKYDQFDERWNEWIPFRDTYRLDLHQTRSVVSVRVPKSKNNSNNNNNSNSNNKDKSDDNTDIIESIIKRSVIVKKTISTATATNDDNSLVLMPPNGVHVLAATRFGKSAKGLLLRERLVYADPNSRNNRGLCDVRVLMCGLMYKRGRRWNKDYKERWFVLQNNMCLYYYEHKGLKASQFSGCIPLAQVRDVKRTFDTDDDKHKKRMLGGGGSSYHSSIRNDSLLNYNPNVEKLSFLQYTFDIDCVKRSYHLACRDNDDLSDWMSVLQGLVHCPLDVENPLGGNVGANVGRRNSYTVANAITGVGSAVGSAVGSLINGAYEKYNSHNSNNNNNKAVPSHSQSSRNLGYARRNRNDKSGTFGAKRGKKTYDITNSNAKVDGRVEWVDRSP